MGIFADILGTTASYLKIGLGSNSIRLKNNAGTLNFRNSGDSADIKITVLDEAYGVGWDGNNEVPTKNAIYDKVQTLGGSYTIVNQTGTTLNETATSGIKVILCDTASNAITVNLPTAVGNTVTFHIKKINSSANAVTVDANASETIDGGATATLNVQYVSITLVSDNSNWMVI